MSKIKGIYAASVSILDNNFSLDVEKTIYHAENLIDQGCHGVAIFGSTGQAQLISVSEKIEMLNTLSSSKYKDKYIIGTGLNSLSETINLMKIAMSLNFKRFLIMPPAYYKYGDKEVISFYSKIVEQIPKSEIILYNFEKLCGYKFSVRCSSYNLYENLKLDNFSILPGSESMLLKGLKLGCHGIITATCNVTASLSRKVYEDFVNGSEQNSNKKLCEVRKIFEEYNLISAIHTFMAQLDSSYNNILPPLSILNDNDKKKLFEKLQKINFNISNSLAA